MKIHIGNTNINKYEHLIEKHSQTVTHLYLKAGQEIPEHSVEASVIVVIYKGKVKFSNKIETQTIVPGNIVEMEPKEVHSLKAVDESGLMVIKSVLK